MWGLSGWQWVVLGGVPNGAGTNWGLLLVSGGWGDKPGGWGLVGGLILGGLMGGAGEVGVDLGAED